VTLSETGAARQAGHFCVPHLAAHLWIDAMDMTIASTSAHGGRQSGSMEAGYTSIQVSWLCLMVFFYSVILASCVRSAWVTWIKGKRRDLIHNKNVSAPGRVGSSSSASSVRRVGSSSSASSVHSLAKAFQSPRLCRLSSDVPSEQASDATTMPGRSSGCDETQFWSRSAPCVMLPPPALKRLSSGSRYFAQIVRQRRANAKMLLD